ncbi:MAG: DUF4233 domain-containing protein [Marmoricola sp.]
MRRRLCAAIVGLEAIVLGLTTPVLISVESVPKRESLAIGLGLFAACVVTAATLRFAWAYWLGWAIQVAALALGFVITMMVVLGVVFLGLWATAYVLGGKIERERAEWEARDRAGQQHP